MTQYTNSQWPLAEASNDAIALPSCPEMDAGTAELRAILSWQRPHNDEAERLFCELYVDDLAALYPVERDGFGNRWLTIDTPPGHPLILWSCHVDTMASKGGRQEVRYQPDGRTLELRKQKPGRVLGADDGAGVWLLREMIRAGVPGTYVFHRGEECARLGSKYVAKYERERLEGFDACIAFDRKGTDNLITHQSLERGVSHGFAQSLIVALEDASNGMLSYVEDDSGSYTDSFTYFDHISECTNLSVGYEREHGPRETLDAMHLWRLRNAMVQADFSFLRIERDPYAMPVYDAEPWWQDDNFHKPKHKPLSLASDDQEELLATLCKSYPHTAATIMGLYGIDVDDFIRELGALDVDELRLAGGL